MAISTYGTKALNWANRNRVKIGIVAAAAGVLAVSNPFSVVYRGSIDGERVVYKEESGLFGWGAKNELRAGRGRERYVFVDHENQNGIEWQSNTATNYLADKLEEFVIVRPGPRRNERFTTEDIDNNATLKGQKSEEFLEKGTPYFNATRGKIREVKRQEYLARLKNAQDFLDKYVK